MRDWEECVGKRNVCCRGGSVEACRVGAKKGLRELWSEKFTEVCGHDAESQHGSWLPKGQCRRSGMCGTMVWGK